jgi:hypothetical protein
VPKLLVTYGKKKKKLVHMLTHGAMQRCGLVYVINSINDKFRDIRQRKVTTRREILTTNIHSLGFRDIRERVTLWGLILRSLGCIAIAVVMWQSLLTRYVPVPCGRHPSWLACFVFCFIVF